MGKRSSFGRVAKDFYLTIDPRAVPPVIPFLKAEGIRSFIDPCWGWGHSVGPLTRAGLTCLGRYDIAPGTSIKVDPDLPGQQGHVIQRDGRDLSFADLNGADAIITNPPWSRDLLNQLIERWSPMVPTWLLFGAGWKHGTTEVPDLIHAHCTDFVPVPRLKWMPGTKDTATDDCGWYRFHTAEASAGHGMRFWPYGSVPDEIRRAA
ncbi:hypothetical protein [Roseibium sp.]|uniref:hypothetical protein n=1 Tax=Roseibium sp. TaxID=1936156 RepID=UPI00329844F1